SHALRALAMLVGDPTAALAVPSALPSADAIRSLVAADTAAPGTTTADLGEALRADVRAAELGARAARADAWRARALYLPRLNGFARYDWNDPSGLFANSRSWTAGVMATWTPFAGASEIAAGRAASARARAAEAQREAATANAALEQARTREALTVALAALTIAERAVAQSAEALRIVSRKYDGGLATISDLLEAQALQTQARLGEAFARYTLITAAAERRQALGGDPTYLAALDGADFIPR
ncbi:MAG: TolC family protein, partial [Gemmatimonadaceae bacterium]|nr:TolC family protein [Gemmatimonadaceae bacterium]